MTIGVPLLPWEVVIRRRGRAASRMSVRDAMVGVAVCALITWVGVFIYRLEDRRLALRAVAETHRIGAVEAGFFGSAIEGTITRAEGAAALISAQADSSGDAGHAALLRRDAADSARLARNLRPSLIDARQRQAHQLWLEAKYLRAARRPYLPVWPDPPSP